MAGQPHDCFDVKFSLIVTRAVNAGQVLSHRERENERMNKQLTDMRDNAITRDMVGRGNLIRGSHSCTSQRALKVPLTCRLGP